MTDGYELQSKYSTAMNAFADVWCQDQSYDITIEPMKEVCEGSTTWTSPDGRSGGGSCNIKTIPAKTETHHYTTGHYLSDENKIECLGESLWGG
jgi:hypothetical protein